MNNKPVVSTKILKLNNKVMSGNFTKNGNKGNAPDPQLIQKMIKNITKKEGE